MDRDGFLDRTIEEQTASVENRLVFRVGHQGIGPAIRSRR